MCLPAYEADNPRGSTDGLQGHSKLERENSQHKLGPEGDIRQGEGWDRGAQARNWGPMTILPAFDKIGRTMAGPWASMF